MNKWEYKRIENPAEEALNALGQECFELVSVVQERKFDAVTEEHYTVNVAYLKRPLEPIEVTIVGDALSVSVENLPDLSVITPRSERGGWYSGGDTEYEIKVSD